MRRAWRKRGFAEHSHRRQPDAARVRGAGDGRSGGAAVSGGLAAPAWPVLSAALTLFVIGWFDDLMPMSALAKMVSSLAVAAFFVFSLTTVEATTPMRAALTIVAMLWFGGLVNAVNLLDNMDGLAAGVAAIAVLRLAGRSPTRGNIDHTSHRLVSAGFTDKTAVSLLYALASAGALTGYLVQAQSGLAWPVAAAFGIGVVMMALWLGRVPAYAGQDFQNVPFAPLLTDLTFR